MYGEPRGDQAAGLRQRKLQLLRRFPIPADLLPGALSRSYTRCGNPRCHGAREQGHEAWSLTFMVQGQRQVERIPRDWGEEVRARAEAGREVLAANAQLLVLARQQRKRRRGRGASARNLLTGRSGTAPLASPSGTPTILRRGKPSVGKPCG